MTLGYTERSLFRVSKAAPFISLTNNIIYLLSTVQFEVRVLNHVVPLRFLHEGSDIGDSLQQLTSQFTTRPPPKDYNCTLEEQRIE